MLEHEKNNWKRKKKFVATRKENEKLKKCACTSICLKKYIK